MELIREVQFCDPSVRHYIYSILEKTSHQQTTSEVPGFFNTSNLSVEESFV